MAKTAFKQKLISEYCSETLLFWKLSPFCKVEATMNNSMLNRENSSAQFGSFGYWFYYYYF